MASAAHAVYCFEALSAAFERSNPPRLAEVEASWNKYQAALTNEAGHESSDDEHQEIADNTEKDRRAYEGPGGRPTDTDRLRAPGVQRLANPSPSSGASSSSQSLQSSRSESSAEASSDSSMSSVAGTPQSGSRAILRPDDKSPLFVTWNVLQNSERKSLRGCIGTFEGQQLERGLNNYALTSAFEDTRFSPISYQELPSLGCSITLLTDFEPAPSPLSWELGIHGLRISFMHHDRRLGATYLPDVAREQGWTKIETMVSLMRKAGWNGRKEDWNKVKDLTVVRYQGRKASATWSEWTAWKTWAEKQ